jgi:hypothetical protein
MEVDRLAKERVARDPKKSYSQAMTEVLAENPELKQAYALRYKSA